jgi:hypothetical protein
MASVARQKSRKLLPRLLEWMVVESPTIDTVPGNLTESADMTA